MPHRRLPAIQGWVQCRLPDGSWGARYAPEKPLDDYDEHRIQEGCLLGEWIEVTTRGGAVITADVVEVVHRDEETILVRYTPTPRGVIY